MRFGRIGTDLQENASPCSERCAGEWTRPKPCDNMRLRVSCDAQENGIALNHVTICDSIILHVPNDAQGNGLALKNHVTICD
jgi:hypothetical protein